jgi:type I restriction enzyme S subunit
MKASILGPVDDAWEVTTLAALCEEGGGSVQTGPFGSQLHASDYVASGIPSVMPKDIGENRVLRGSLAMISAADAERLARHRMQPGDIVYSRRGDVERRALITSAESGWLCGTGCIRVRLGDQATTDSVFLSYYLGHPEVRRWIVRHAVGATMANLNTGILGAVPVVVPPPDQQRRIAGLLGSLDDKIDLNQRIAAASEGLAVAELAARLDDAEWAPLGELACHHKAAVDPSALGSQDVDHFSLPAFDAGCRPVREPATSIKSGKLRVQQGDILVSRLNPRIPRVWAARTSPDVQAMGSTEFLVLRPADVAVTPGLIFAAVSQPVVSSDMAQRASGTSGSHQRIKPADAMAVPVPVVKDSALSTLLDDLVETAGHARQEAASLANLRDALLPKLLSGELRVGADEDAMDGVA